MPSPAIAVATTRDTSSSDGKIFAKASKEWTIPPRPRPGRKAAEVPKAVAAGKGNQNREAQRAFRERKQDYVAELEQRIRDYEQQEVQKNISLQQISLVLKNENKALKAENNRLRELVVQLGGDPTVTPGSTTSSRSTRAGTTSATSKKRKVKPEPGLDDEAAARVLAHASTSNASLAMSSTRRRQSSVSSSVGTAPGSPSASTTSKPPLSQFDFSFQHEQAGRGSVSPGRFTLSNSDFNAASGSPFDQRIPQSPVARASSPSSHSHSASSSYGSSTMSSSAKSVASSSSAATQPEFDCSFCSVNDSPCICRMAAEASSSATKPAPATPTNSPLPTSLEGLLNVEMIAPTLSDPAPSFGIDIPAAKASPFSSSSSTGAVRLRRHAQPSTSSPVIRASIWTVTSASPSLSNNDAECTGDPSSCPACKDDPFGKAFCETLEASVCAGDPENRCDNCKAGADAGVGEGEMRAACCGVPEACGAALETTKSEPCIDEVAAKAAAMMVGPSPPTTQVNGEMISASDAWRQFKSHPNATFADLSLLAEVVSRRTKCFTPHLPLSPSPLSQSTTLGASNSMDDLPALVSAPSARPAKKRRLEVDAEGVKEAMRMLDARSGVRAPGEVGVVEELKRGRRLSDIRGTLDGSMMETEEQEVVALD